MGWFLGAVQPQKLNKTGRLHSANTPPFPLSPQVITDRGGGAILVLAAVGGRVEDSCGNPNGSPEAPSMAAPVSAMAATGESLSSSSGSMASPDCPPLHRRPPSLGVCRENSCLHKWRRLGSGLPGSLSLPPHGGRCGAEEESLSRASLLGS